jgi:DNA repair exonuclease SbcCD ATPase subunit
MLSDYGDRLKALTKDPVDVPNQLQRLDEALSSRTGQLRATESEYRSLSDRRREARKRLESGKERREEVGGLLQRFTLLERHYVSDVQRLKGIEEGGTLFEVLGKAVCPLCGALPEHHRAEECGCDASAVVATARSEIAKIAVLRAELVGTIDDLRKEALRFDRRLPQLEEELRAVATEIEKMVAPRLAQLRASYSELADKKGQVREAASLLETIVDIEERRAHLEKQENDEKSSSVSSGDLPSTVADEFSKTVEAILKEWHFPEAERVHFDPKKRDLVIAGKLRTARGKGLRAITHSAFTIALLEYCRANIKPHLSPPSEDFCRTF